jgi:hypothetical protein
MELIVPDSPLDQAPILAIQAWISENGTHVGENAGQ